MLMLRRVGTLTYRHTETGFVNSASRGIIIIVCDCDTQTPLADKRHCHSPRSMPLIERYYSTIVRLTSRDFAQFFDFFAVRAACIPPFLTICRKTFAEKRCKTLLKLVKTKWNVLSWSNHQTVKLRPEKNSKNLKKMLDKWESVW